MSLVSFLCHNNVDDCEKKERKTKKSLLFFYNKFINNRRRVCTFLVCMVIIFLRILLLNDHHYDHHSSSTTLRIQQPMDLPYGEREDLREGKFCIYNTQKKSFLITNWLFFWPKAITANPWDCQECNTSYSDDNDNGHNKRRPSTKCRKLERRGRCPSFRREEVDGGGFKPRVKTKWNEFTTVKSHTLTMHHDGHKEYAQKNTPSCSGTLSLPCFNLTRCNKNVLKVYPYGKTLQDLVDTIIVQQNEEGGGNEEEEGSYRTEGILLKRVKSEEEACLFIVNINSFDSPSKMTSSSHWNNGQNHYIFESSYLFDSHADRPFNTKVNFGMAAVSPVSMDDAYVREGYDTPLSLWPTWKKPNNSTTTTNQRKFLISFKGNIFRWEQRSWQHRWIAAEYWNHEEDERIQVDTKCGLYYDYSESTSYTELLLHSTFFFCPGGGGVGSFRFAETLRAGAIPVVTSDFVPPFHPEIDWTDCIVRVSEARVVAIPDIVGNISQDEIHKRQNTCKLLYETVFGDSDNRDFALLSVALRIWAVRVKNALQKQSEIFDMIYS